MFLILSIYHTKAYCKVAGCMKSQKNGEKMASTKSTRQDLKIKKWLSEKEKILDHMDSEELAANLFRATQTEAKIRRENIKWQDKASITHYEIWKKVRKTIQEIWGTMPEDLPAVEDIKMAEKRLKNNEKKKLGEKSGF